jgi:hypothetical protein
MFLREYQTRYAKEQGSEMRDEAAPIFPKEVPINRFSSEKMVDERMVEEKMAEEPIRIEEDKKTA